MNHHSKENPPFSLDQNAFAGTTTVTGDDVVVMPAHQRLPPNEHFRHEKTVVSNTIQMLHSAIDRVIHEEIMQPMIEQQQQHRAMMEEFHSTPLSSADENQTNAFLVRCGRSQRCLFAILIFILVNIPWFFHTLQFPELATSRSRITNPITRYHTEHSQRSGTSWN